MSTAKEVVAEKFKAAERLVAAMEHQAEQCRLALELDSLAQKHRFPPDPEWFRSVFANTTNVFWPSLLDEDLASGPAQSAEFLADAEEQMFRLTELFAVLSEPQSDPNALASSQREFIERLLKLIEAWLSVAKPLRDRYVQLLTADMQNEPFRRKKRKRGDLFGLAVGALAQNSALSVSEIAQEIGCVPSSLYRNKKFMNAYRLALTGAPPPKGYRQKDDSGRTDIESYDNDRD